MDVLLLSRLQFAMTTMFHFVFVPLTMGLSLMIAFMETRYVTTRNDLYLRMTKFWGRLFLINFALGIVTGITLEFQFGTNWSEYSRYVGDIFGAPLAVESLVAFFLESTFIGLWIFGWKRISPALHAGAMWIVAFASNLSALWILLANGWMQRPVGYVISNGRAEMTDFWSVVKNSFGLLEFGHTVLATWTVAAFFVMGIASWHLLRHSHTDFFQKSFKYGAILGLAASFGVFIIGDLHGAEVAASQPSKMAAMESVWQTQSGAAYNLIVIPRFSGDGNYVQTLGIPKLLSFLATKNFNGTVIGMNDVPRDERPPIWPVFASFRLMVGLGLLFMLLSVIATYKVWRNRVTGQRWFLWLMLLVIPLPYLAAQLGWMVTEIGRQPWIVYGVLRTADAVSPVVSLAQVGTSFIAFAILYGSLASLDVYLLYRIARRGPDGDTGHIIKTTKPTAVEGV